MFHTRLECGTLESGFVKMMRKRNTPSVEDVVVACDLSTVRTIVQGRQRTMYSTPETPFSLLTFDYRRLAVVQQEGPSKCPLQVP